MKKLKLKLDGIKEMLTKDQMKKVAGGYNPNQCIENCYSSASSYCAHLQSMPPETGAYTACYYSVLGDCLVACACTTC